MKLGHLESLNPFILGSVASSIQHLTGKTGCFSSPNFPGNYPNNIKETYKITADPGSWIKLNFIKYSLQSSCDCEHDYLRIRWKNGSLASTLCGTNLNPGDFVSQDNELTVEFKTDGSVTAQGFFAMFVVTNGSAPAPSPSPSPAPSPSPFPSPSRGMILTSLVNFCMND